VGAHADYVFNNDPALTFPVQGARVTVTIVDPKTQQTLGTYTGARTDVWGNFSQPILTPAEIGIYTLLVTVSDGTVTTPVYSTLNVIPTPEPVPPQPSPPSPPGGPVTNVYLCSDSIV
jgi:hypothetical protein